MDKIYLKLQNGEVFEGKSFGKSGEVSGEVVFVTSMVGYLEVLTDPAYQGQIVVQTFPLIGNYGIISSDFESEHPRLAGYVVREMCDVPSNFRSEGRLDDYLKKTDVVGICDIDTRQITKIIRQYGTMKGIISTKRESAFNFAEKPPKLVPYVQKGVEMSGSGKRVAYIDFGSRKSARSELAACGFEVAAIDANASLADIAALKPCGVVLSEGVGDPRDCAKGIALAKSLLGKYPLLGVGLGHQLIALAMGGEVKKMKYGHRGANQPVRYSGDGRTYITAQNHGFEVVAKSVKKGVEVLQNINDNTNEGMFYHEANAFGVQFAPMSFIYKKFDEMTEGKAYAD